MSKNDDIGNTPLHVAIENNNTSEAMKLINAGADVNAKNIFGETPLHYAAFYARSELLGALIKRGGDVNLQSMSSADERSITAKTLAFFQK